MAGLQLFASLHKPWLFVVVVLIQSIQCILSLSNSPFGPHSCHTVADAGSSLAKQVTARLHSWFTVPKSRWSYHVKSITCVPKGIILRYMMKEVACHKLWHPLKRCVGRVRPFQNNRVCDCPTMLSCKEEGQTFTGFF